MNNCIPYHDPTHLLGLSYGLIKYVSIGTDTNNRVLAVINILRETPETLSTDTLTGATAAHIKVVSLQSDDHGTEYLQSCMSPSSYEMPEN